MYDGSKPATVAAHDFGTARRTNPAPQRNTAIPQSDTAPAMPSDPPITKHLP
jgi:hypothetical protein